MNKGALGFKIEVADDTFWSPISDQTDSPYIVLCSYYRCADSHCVLGWKHQGLGWVEACMRKQRQQLNRVKCVCTLAYAKVYRQVFACASITGITTV